MKLRKNRLQETFCCHSASFWMFCHAAVHAAVWCDANTEACCPEQLLAFPSTDLRHTSQALWPQIAWTLSTTQAVLALLSASVTIFLSQFLLWSFPVQPLSTHSNLILMTTVSLSNPTLWVLLEGLNTNTEHVGDIRALSPIASMGNSVPNCLGGLISEPLIGIKNL